MMNCGTINNKCKSNIDIIDCNDRKNKMKEIINNKNDNSRKGVVRKK